VPTTVTKLPRHKTRIVCTIGPGSADPQTLERMIRAGMTVARLNLAHGNVDAHSAMIRAVRAASKRTGVPVVLLADLPGPKLRLGGRVPGDEMVLEKGQTVRVVASGATQAAKTSDPSATAPFELSLDMPALPRAVRVGTDIFINDGYVHLRALVVDETAILARVLTGGSVRSRDGVALPGIDLGGPSFTANDRELLTFALGEGIGAIAVSFVEGPEDITAVREAAAGLRHELFVIAKIERARAIERLDEILAATDGIMVARGDLGVDLPIERIAVEQKRLIARANAGARPVITATQILESMTEHRRPSRAEVADITNAILDGTDCLMLSEETAIGRYPVEAVRVMSRVAEFTERRLPVASYRVASGDSLVEVLAEQAVDIAERLRSGYIIVPEQSGMTARTVARLRPSAWIIAISADKAACEGLQFSRGVQPVWFTGELGEPTAGENPELTAGAQREPTTNERGAGNWLPVVHEWFRQRQLDLDCAVLLVGGRRIEILRPPRT